MSAPTFEGNDECKCIRGAGGRCRHCDSRLGVDFSWQSTPQLWAAMRPDYDGAIDSKYPIGFGKTKADAVAALIEQEDGR